MDWELITGIVSIISLLVSLIAVGVTVWTVFRTHVNDKKSIRFEKRIELYSKLSYFLQQLISNHDLILKYEDELFGLIAKSYFFSSPFVNEQFNKMLDLLQIEKTVLSEKNREKSFNQFDASIDILLKAMKKEMEKQGDISESEMRLVIESSQLNIGNLYINGGNQ